MHGMGRDLLHGLLLNGLLQLDGLLSLGSMQGMGHGLLRRLLCTLRMRLIGLREVPRGLPWSMPRQPS
jgi:hypothetical protein